LNKSALDLDRKIWQFTHHWTTVLRAACGS